MNKFCVSVVVLVASAASALAEPSLPILDIGINSSGEVADMGSVKRGLSISQALVGTTDGKKCISFLGGKSIVIPFEKDDPLFKDGPFTWIGKCKIRNPTGADFNIRLFGR